MSINEPLTPLFFNLTRLTGSGRVFSRSGIWPKYSAGFGKTRQKTLTGNGIWLLPGKRYWPKFGHEMRIFLPVCREFGKSYVLAVNTNQPGELSVVSPYPFSLFVSSALFPSLYHTKVWKPFSILQRPLKHAYIRNVNRKGQSTP